VAIVRVFARGIGALVLLGLAVVALGVAFRVVVGMFTIGVFLLKVLLFGLLLSWLARVVFGWGRPQRTGGQLVGRPVVDVPAPTGRVRDKYEIAAEKELDKELGF